MLFTRIEFIGTGKRLKDSLSAKIAFVKYFYLHKVHNIEMLNAFLLRKAFNKLCFHFSRSKSTYIACLTTL